MSASSPLSPADHASPRTVTTEPTPTATSHPKRQRILSPSLSPIPRSTILSDATPITSSLVRQDAPSGEPGRHAGSVFYHTQELRQILLDHLDRTDLANMARLEKDAVVSVAPLLYHKIHVSVISKMSRLSSRREIYSAAVRILDRSPKRPLISDVYSSHLNGSSRTSLDPDSLLETINAWRIAFPNLREVLYDHPEEANEVPYVVRFEGEHIHLDIEARWQIDISCQRIPRPARIHRLFPSTPQSKSGEIIVHHYILLELIYSSEQHSVDSMSSAICNEWKSFIFENPELDGRIIGVSMPDTLRHKLEISDDGIISFAAARQTAGSPIRRLELSLAGGGTIQRMREIAAATGPAMRTLFLDSTGLEVCNWPSIIAAVGEAFPQLEHLAISTVKPRSKPLDITVPLKGLPNLRTFDLAGELVICPESRGGVPPDLFTVARCVSGLGSKECIYRLFGEVARAKDLHHLVGKLKSTHPSYAYPHVITAGDLDLWSQKSLDSADFEITTREKMRRVGWLRTAELASEFSRRQIELLAAFDKHKSATETFQQLLEGAVAELAGTEGDLPLQGQILRARFEMMHTREGELGVVHNAMRREMDELRGVSATARRYDMSWLAHQDKDK